MTTSGQYFEGVGRRKEASARVRIYPGGSGNVVINDKDGKDFLPRLGDLDLALAPLRVTGLESVYNVSVKVSGGGITGQTSAITLGLARALLKVDPELRATLRKAGLLTRDARIKERKKPGLRRARKAPTYTKR
ncbi:MAG: 30S ribosomal protein S9 [Anaerolineae bacterium]|nr:30S ribosomal protein S9 [Anaerolineae bacterium]